MKFLFESGRSLVLGTVAVFCLVSSSAVRAQAIAHYSFIGASGEVTFALTPDNCTTINGDIFVAASGSQANSPSANAGPIATGTLFIVNSCANTANFISGATSTFQFASQGGNGTDTPHSITASGQIPLADGTGTQVDVLSFQLTLNRIGSIVYQLDGDAHTTYPSGSPLVVSHYSNVLSLATASLTVSTQSLGALYPLTVNSAVVQNNKSHEVDINR